MSPTPESITNGASQSQHWNEMMEVRYEKLQMQFHYE